MLEPTASPDVISSADVHGTLPVATVAHEEEKRPGAKRGFIVNAVMAIACPCIPAAQVASAVGHSYFIVLVSFTLLYTTSAVAYWFGANADHTFVDGTSPLSAYAAQTVTYIGGPFVSLLVAFYKYSNARWSSGMGTLVTSVGELNEELNAKMSVSIESLAFIAADLALNLVLALVILYLHNRLDRRTNFSAGENTSSCTSTLQVLCCASCSLFEMVWVAKDAAKKPQFHVGPIDELPAFERRDLVEKTEKLPTSNNDSAAACPA